MTTGKLRIDELEKSDLLRIILFGLHLQATEAGNGDGFCTRTVIPKDIWDILYDGELLFSTTDDAEGNMVITTETVLEDELF